MSFTITWSIAQLRTLDHVSDGFVTHVVYLATATEDSAEAWYRGQIEFETPAESFTPLQDLTEDQVVQWVLMSLGQEEVERITDNLRTQIGYQLNPPVAPKAIPLPWTTG